MEYSNINAIHMHVREDKINIPNGIEGFDVYILSSWFLHLTNSYLVGFLNVIFG